MSLTGKSAVITGGTGGIGCQICKILLNENIKNLAVIDLKGEKLIEKLKKDFPNCNILFKILDIGNTEMIDVAFNEIKQNFKNIDIVINSAGIINDRNIEKTLHVNIAGVLNSSFAAIKHMSIQNNEGEGGIIINVSSIAALNPVFSYPIYSASKCAVLGFTRCMGDERHFEKTGIKFVSLCPGGTMTSLFTQGFSNILYPEYKYNVTRLQIQSPMDVAKVVLEILMNGKNGSIWVCEAGKYKEIYLPKIE